MPADNKTAGVQRLVRWRWVAAPLALLCLIVGVTPAVVAAQSDENGLVERSINSFEFDPAGGAVRVTIDIELRNVTTDRVEGDVVNRTFFDGYFVGVPLGAQNIVATVDGNTVPGELISDPAFPAFSTYRFELGRDLFSGQSATARVTYDHL